MIGYSYYNEFGPLLKYASFSKKYQEPRPIAAFSRFLASIDCKFLLRAMFAVFDFL